MHSLATAKDRRTDHAKWILLILPLLLAWANPTWLFTTPMQIDAWVYFGYFNHLIAYKTTLFPNLYYGTRLSWILPGYFAYRLFDPLLANYVLHFGFYYAAVFSCYSLLKRSVGERNALLGAILLGTYGPFLSAIGWDYVDGPGATYFLVALAASAQATERRAPLWLLTSGAFALAMFYTNMFLLVFLPFVPLLYLFIASTGWNRTLLLAIKDVVIWFVLGGILISAIIGWINYLIDKHFWFYWPSIAFYLNIRKQANPWHSVDWGWLRRAIWLGIPAGASLATLVYTIRNALRRRLQLGDFTTFFVFQFLAIAIGMLTWQIVGSTGLSLYFYASYMIPVMFLAIGSVLGRASDQIRSVGWWALLLGSIGVLLLTVNQANGTLARQIHARTNFVVVGSIAAAGLLCSVLFSRQRYMVAPAVLGLAVYQLGYSGLQSRMEPIRSYWQNVVEGENALWSEQQRQHVWFWYDRDALHGSEMNGINATYLWGWTFVGPHFPKIEVPSRLSAGSSIVMPMVSNQWLAQADEVLAQNHLRASLVRSYTVGHDKGAFKMGIFSLEALPPD